jgi:predicted RNase H-like nuclease (RuvC/YqgF family)
VEPILDVLVGKTLEQSMMEVMEEEELAELRAHQEEFVQLRNAELAETQRMEEAERRKFEEKERRLKQERERLQREQVHMQDGSDRFMSRVHTSVEHKESEPILGKS